MVEFWSDWIVIGCYLLLPLTFTIIMKCDAESMIPVFMIELAGGILYAFKRFIWPLIYTYCDFWLYDGMRAFWITGCTTLGVVVPLYLFSMILKHNHVNMFNTQHVVVSGGNIVTSDTDNNNVTIRSQRVSRRRQQ
jgi:hypothetical protein